ncbi:MAG TPA: hypothetical protein VMH80_18885 [Bryobacteraceae bacterium]|nr:hypothetical protein [Bryobacteraceae bacterium]
MHPAVQSTTSVVRNWRIRFILASLVFAAPLFAADPPGNLIRLVAARETQTAEAQSNYTYRQSVTLDELDKRGLTEGSYHEVRDIIFSPTQARTEQFAEKPSDRLTHIKLTDEDFRDIREIQPFLLTKDQVFLYETHFRGEETIDGVDCWVVQISPRQILDGQRLFDGMIWAAKSDYSIVRSEGQAVPQIHLLKSENLFPHFTTLREKVDGDLWFPVLTYGDDTLYFRGGAQRIRLRIRYTDYKKFGADSKITFAK